MLKKQQVNQALNNDINNQIRMEQLMRSQQNINSGISNVNQSIPNNVQPMMGQNTITPNVGINSNNINQNRPEVLFGNMSNNTNM